MCNSLHEIDPNNWVREFGEHDTLNWALRPEGCLLIVEDYLMPHGELAHEYGFLVLNAEQLKALFCTNKQEGFQTIDIEGKYSGRIRCHVVPAKAISRVSKESRAEAIKLARAEAETRIRRLRESKNADSKAGMDLAFWTHQLANCVLARGL